MTHCFVPESRNMDMHSSISAFEHNSAAYKILCPGYMEIDIFGFLLFTTTGKVWQLTSDTRRGPEAILLSIQPVAVRCRGFLNYSTSIRSYRPAESGTHMSYSLICTTHCATRIQPALSQAKLTPNRLIMLHKACWFLAIPYNWKSRPENCKHGMIHIHFASTIQPFAM